MTPEELIQLMRTCSLAKVRAELEKWAQDKENDGYNGSPNPSGYDFIVSFYKSAAKRK